MPKDDLVAKIREVLEASASARKMISFSEIETRIGEKVVAWNKVLDPIYEVLADLILMAPPSDQTALMADVLANLGGMVLEKSQESDPANPRRSSH
jgi:hypothetical protein